jgi:hypothetical protein
VDTSVQSLTDLKDKRGNPTARGEVGRPEQSSLTCGEMKRAVPVGIRQNHVTIEQWWEGRKAAGGTARATCRA